MSSVTLGVFYIWDKSSNALIRSFAQVREEEGVFLSPTLEPGGCSGLRRGNWGRGGVLPLLYHYLRKTEKSPGRVPGPAAPLQCGPPGRARGSVRVTGCAGAGSRYISEERHLPTSPLCLRQKAQNRRAGNGHPWDPAPRRQPTSAGLRAPLC